MGDLEGLFIADETEVNAAIGEHLYFGEVLGKHSEIEGTFEEGEARILNIPEETVVILENELGSTLSGFNPLQYLSCPYCNANLRDEGCCCKEEKTCS